MHAIVGASKMKDGGDPNVAKGILEGLSQAPGFVSGTFTRSLDGSRGRSMVLFETEAAAKSAMEAALAKIPADAPLEIESVEVYEVVAHS